MVMVELARWRPSLTPKASEPKLEPEGRADGRMARKGVPAPWEKENTLRK